MHSTERKYDRIQVAGGYLVLSSLEGFLIANTAKSTDIKEYSFKSPLTAV